MPRFRCSQGNSCRLEVAHLAYEDHVGILAQRGSEGRGEALGVSADLALVHHRAPVLVEVLYRILQRDDVTRALAVDNVNERRKRRALSAPCWAGYKHHAPGLVGQFADGPGQAQLLKRADGRWYHAEGSSDRLALPVGIDPESCDAGNAIGEVDFTVSVEARQDLRVHQAGHQGFGVWRHQPVDAFHGPEGTVNPHHWRQTHRDM